LVTGSSSICPSIGTLHMAFTLETGTPGTDVYLTPF
jgi:hypothetical protein